MLELVADTGCCISNVGIKAPVTIWDAPPVEVAPEITPPPGWDPQVSMLA